MKDLFKRSPFEDSNPKVYNFLSQNESAKFYDEFYNSAFKKTKSNTLTSAVKDKERTKGTAYRIMEEIVSFLEKKLNPDALVLELGGGMFQQRSADAYKRFKNYVPLDIGYSNILGYTKKYDKEGIVADATELPFKDESIDCIITHAFLEHPIQPEKVLSEIVRVLKPGGIVVHNDAWFCRWWQHFGVVGLKKFSQMTTKEKTINILARITELPPVKVMPIITKRFFKLLFKPAPKKIELSYSKLKPNYNLYLGCDEDAASRIDPLDVIRYYESRNFELIHHLSFKQKLLYPNRYIMLRKNA